MELTLAVCALVLFATATAEVGECEMSDLFTGGTLEREMAKLLLTNSNSTHPTITVLRNHTVCLSVGPTRGKVSSISLVIEYNCTGSVNCPTGGRGIEQYDFGCNNQSQWSFVQFGDLEHGRTRNSTANFDTSLRTECGACFPVYKNESIPPATDPITHCHECRRCSDFGQSACYGTDPSECCSVYVNDMCAGACPSPSDVIDVNFTCRSSQSTTCSSDDVFVAMTVILIIVVVLLTTALIISLMVVYRCYGSVKKHRAKSFSTDDNTTHSARLLSVSATRYQSNEAYETVQKSKLQESAEVMQNNQECRVSTENLYCEVKEIPTGADNDSADYVI